MSPQLSALRQRPGVLRVAILVLSIIGIIFAAIDIALQSTDAIVGYEAAVIIYIALTTYCYSIAWSVSAICVLLFHGAYPPGVDIGLDFIGWGLGWGFAFTLFWWAEYINYPSGCYQGCTPERATMAMEILAGVMAFAYGAIHLYFFAQGIRNEIKERRMGRTKKFESLQDGDGRQLSEDV